MSLDIYAVVGSRDFSDEALLYETLDNYILYPEHSKIISGGAKGADTLAIEYAKDNQIEHEEYLANWKDMSEPCLKKVGRYGEYNALAGINRNTILAEKASIIIAFWNGKSKGTHDMIEKGKRFKKNTIIIYYE